MTLGGIAHSDPSGIPDTSTNDAVIALKGGDTSTFAHELGHALSLIDSNVNDGTVMGYPIGGYTNQGQCTAAEDAGYKWQLYDILTS